MQGIEKVFAVKRRTGIGVRKNLLLRLQNGRESRRKSALRRNPDKSELR